MGDSDFFALKNFHSSLMARNELAILEEFEQRFQRLESTMKMLIDSDLDDRVATLESLLSRREVDPMLEVEKGYTLDVAPSK